MFDKDIALNWPSLLSKNKISNGREVWGQGGFDNAVITLFKGPLSSLRQFLAIEILLKS